MHLHGTHFPRQLVPHSPTHWITQDALLDMIDAIDADMHARPTPWLLVLDCAPQHVAAEFRSIMRDTRPHIKLCFVQRNFTGYTHPLDRAYMRAFKNSIPSEVAKHFAEFFLEVESNFERANLDSSTSVLRQLLLSFVHTAAQNADSPPASQARVHVRVVVVCCCFPVHPFCLCDCCVHSSRFSPVPSLAFRMWSNDQCDGNQCCPSFGGCLCRHHQEWSLRLDLTQHGKNAPGSDLL